MKFLVLQLGKLEFMLKYKDIIRMVKEAAKCRQFLVNTLRQSVFMNTWSVRFRSVLAPLKSILAILYSSLIFFLILLALFFRFEHLATFTYIFEILNYL